MDNESEIEIDGVKYFSTKTFGAGCDDCSFLSDEKCMEPTAPCMPWQRGDGRDVIFVEKHP